MIIHIPAEYDGRLLRSYLKLTLGLSTAVLAKLKNHERGILVNGNRVTVRYVLRAGDVLELLDRDTEDTATDHVIPVDLPLEVLYEDDHVIALNKPANMPTHPSHGHVDDTLANALAYRYARATEPFVFRPLGRLDRNTSGVVIAGKTRAASGCLGRALKGGAVSKGYVALLEGEIGGVGDVHTIIAPIYRPDSRGIKREVGDDSTPDCVYAETRYVAIASQNGHSVVLCRPVTGRTHQLRVHFAHLGYPILGDDLYGNPSDLIGRHALHALSIGLPLPFYGQLSPQSLPLSDGEIDCAQPNQPTSDGYLRTWAELPADMHRAAKTIFGEAIPALTFDKVVGHFHRLSH